MAEKILGSPDFKRSQTSSIFEGICITCGALVRPKLPINHYCLFYFETLQSDIQ